MQQRELTPRQQQILDLVRSELARSGSFPPLNWLAARLGITTKRGVAIHLDALARKGYINRNTQYFELTDRHSFSFATGLAAGAAQEAFDAEERVSFNPEYFGKGELAAIRVVGESMAGDSIHDGDVVIIAMGSEVGRHDIAAVRVDGSELSLKRIAVSEKSVELLPSNPQFTSTCYERERVAIVGKYVGLVRKS
jgi:repressor LexA